MKLSREKRIAAGVIAVAILVLVYCFNQLYVLHHAHELKKQQQTVRHRHSEFALSPFTDSAFSSPLASRASLQDSMALGAPGTGSLL